MEHSAFATKRTTQSVGRRRVRQTSQNEPTTCRHLLPCHPHRRGLTAVGVFVVVPASDLRGRVRTLNNPGSITIIHGETTQQFEPAPSYLLSPSTSLGCAQCMWCITRGRGRARTARRVTFPARSGRALHAPAQLGRGLAGGGEGVETSAAQVHFLIFEVRASSVRSSCAPLGEWQSELQAS